MLSIIYPYRNREFVRLENSLQSLNNQENKDFEVFLVDYGSEVQIAIQIEKLCSSFSFVKYIYHPTQHQPWNKSKALNSIIKNLKTNFCFVADIDMIFHPKFVERALKSQVKDKTIYFQVGFLAPNQSIKEKNFFSFKKYRLSSFEATGLSMFPTRVLKELKGFDEFYHCWGAEDTDMHERIKNAGYEVEFYDEEILMLHQWHSSYRSSENKELRKDLQISGIVQLNHYNLKHVMEHKTTELNQENWGECIIKEELNELEKTPVNFILDNEQRKIDHLLYVVMPGFKKGILKITIRKNPIQNSFKFVIKKIIRKKVPEFYTLKQINDKVLLHIISFYRNKPYTFKISEDLKEIEISIKF